MKRYFILLACVFFCIPSLADIGHAQASMGNYFRAYLSIKYQLSRELGHIYLSLQFHHMPQTKSLSCEANSATDLINYYRLQGGVPAITEAEFLSKLPIDPDPMIRVKHKGQSSTYIWGDPDKYFVGELDGKQSSNRNVFTGYGINPSGIAPAINSMLRRENLRVVTGPLSEHNILSSLTSGNPVMFWYMLPTSIDKKGIRHYDTNPISWQTPEWKSINGYIGQHAGLIVGARLDELGHIQALYFYQGRRASVDTMDFDEIQKFGAYFPDALYVKKR